MKKEFWRGYMHAMIALYTGSCRVLDIIHLQELKKSIKEAK